MLSRTAKAKLNISTSLVMQVVAMVTGLIIPQVLIRAFGATVYGATASIAGFLAYISLVEGGVAGVARAAFYKPLAENDKVKINGIYCETARFFRVVGLIFAGYSLLLSCGFQFIAKENGLDWLFTFLLTLVISISTLVQYFFGITNMIYLYARQETYVCTLIAIVMVSVNATLVVLLVHMGCGIITVKLMTAAVYVSRPAILAWYVRKKHLLKPDTHAPKTHLMTQKWAGMGQHLAYFLHFNTAITVLTLFANLAMVAVYSIYSLLITGVRAYATSFTSGMEAAFGSMYAHGEHERLTKSFNYYETLISVTSLFLFAATYVLIVPFVRIYTQGLTDADYIQPLFAALFVLSELIYCLRFPYQYMTQAANHYKQTQLMAYAEAAINIIISVALVSRLGLVSVVLGAFISNLVRFIYYAWYLSRDILYRKMSLFIKRMIVNGVLLTLIVILGDRSIEALGESTDYLQWVLSACVVCAMALVVILTGYYLFYREDMNAILAKVIKRA